MNQTDFENKIHKLYNAIQSFIDLGRPIGIDTDIVSRLDKKHNNKLYHNSKTQLIKDADIEMQKLDTQNASAAWHSYYLRRSFLLIEQREKFVGGFWYGSVKYDSDVKYCEKFNFDFKERVRAYWGYKCFECGKPQSKKRLSVHHVHYDKRMCCNGSPRDVVPLCVSCHNKTNYNREYWENHFTELLYAYSQDGKCFFTKKEMKERDP